MKKANIWAFGACRATTSLKSPWILKMILEILEFRVQYDLLCIFSQITAAMWDTSMLHITSVQFFSDMWICTFFCGFLFGRYIVIPDHQIAMFPSNFYIIENPGKILEISWNYPWILSWKFCGILWSPRLGYTSLNMLKCYDANHDRSSFSWNKDFPIGDCD